ncbi:ubiquitin-protein ligase E3A-like isoform X2 [Gordionus sp. m RMFG-2023]|uniref:ubiquitin-protein ligase E3A-like isoform X2 n=1 Tax=Gordionus sp. m RMFG-2023 TaxID=3053472 RepID=UPI0031FD8F10
MYLTPILDEQKDAEEVDYKNIKTLNLKVLQCILKRCVALGNFNELIVIIIRVFSSSKNLSQSFLKDFSVNYEELSKSIKSHLLTSSNLSDETFDIFKKSTLESDDIFKPTSSYKYEDNPSIDTNYDSLPTEKFNPNNINSSLLTPDSNIPNNKLDNFQLPLIDNITLSTQKNNNSPTTHHEINEIKYNSQINQIKVQNNRDGYYKEMSAILRRDDPLLIRSLILDLDNEVWPCLSLLFSPVARRNFNFPKSVLTSLSGALNALSFALQFESNADNFLSKSDWSVHRQDDIGGQLVRKNDWRGYGEFSVGCGNVFVLVFALLPIILGQDAVTNFEDSSDTPLIDYKSIENSSLFTDALPQFCRAVANLPLSLKARLTGIFASVFNFEDMSIIVSALQTIIDIKIDKENYQGKRYVNDDKIVKNVVGVLEIFHCASLLVGHVTVTHYTCVKKVVQEKADNQSGDLTGKEMKHINNTSRNAHLISMIWKDLSSPIQSRSNKLEARLSKTYPNFSISTVKNGLLKPEAFVNSHLERVLIIERDYLDFRFPKNSEQFCFLHHPYLLSTNFKQKALHLDNRIRMYDERRVVYLQNLLQGFSYTPPYLKFKVRRTHLIQDSLSNLEIIVEENPEHLKKQLIVEFEDETGHDQGGLSKEFFQLIIEQIFNQDYGMFVYEQGSQCFWFNSQPFENWSEYYLIGTIIGLAIYNGIILDIKFPPVLYSKLYGNPGTLEDLQQIYPELYQGLCRLLEHEGDIVEDIFGTNFKICVKDMYGNMVEHMLKPNGDTITVDNENREEYAALYAHYLLNTCVEEQFSAFKRGFDLVIDSKSPLYRLFTPSELELLICGDTVYDFNDLEKATTYEGGYTRETPVIEYFWNTVHGMDTNQKCSLLKFATGSDRVPLGGLANLKLIISRQGPDSDRLPTAHTCFNYFLLPEYDSEKKLKDRILKALNHAKGFGLI